MFKICSVLLLTLMVFPLTGLAYANSSGQALRVCILEDDPPYTFQDKNGQWQGYDVDILRAFNLPYSIEFIGTGFATSLAMLDREQCSMFLASIPLTEERKKRFLFSYPHITSNLHMLVRRNSPITRAEQLQYVIIGVLKGSLAEDYALENFPKSTIFALRHESKLIKLLYDGDIDVLIGDRPKLHEIQGVFPDLHIVEPPLKEQQSVFIFSKNSKELRDIINNKIIEIEDEGILLRLYDAWFRKAKYPLEIYGK